MKKKLGYLLLLLTLFYSCASRQRSISAITEGVHGKVSWTAGNMMPSIGTPNSGSSKAIARTVRIYEVTKYAQADGQAPLYSAIKTKLVASVKTNADGYFQCQLAPGKYSIFTVEDEGKLFASMADGDGNISPFEVKANELTKYDINVNYKAAY